MRYLTFLLLLISMTSCTDQTFQSFDELTPNPLDTGGPALFTATDVRFIPRGNFLRDVEVNYAHIHDQLSPELRNNIIGVRITTPERQIDTDLNRTRIYEQNYAVGANLCYVFTFINNRTESRETEICFTVE